METNEMIMKSGNPPGRMLLVRLVVLTVLLSAVAFCIMSDSAQAQNISEEARRYLARGDAAMEMAKSSDEYAPAIEEYRKALGLEPRWPMAHHRLGIAYEKARKITEAISCFSEYLSLSPNAPDADQMRDRSLAYVIHQRSISVDIGTR